MRALRIIGTGAAVLTALIVVLLLAVKLFVNPNDYRGRLEQAVQRSTGRQLQLAGDLKLSVFPWIALELGSASLGNPAGFPAEPFATVQHAAFRVRLLPLLSKRLEVGRIEIDGLDLRLRKNAAGKGNWQEFGNRGAPPAPPTAASNPGGASSDAGMLHSVGGVSVKDSRISYQDTVADHISLTTGSFASGTTLPVDLALTLTRGSGTQPLPVSANLQLKLDLSAQTLEVPAFTAQLAQAKLSGDLQGQKILDAPAISGSFKLDTVSPRELMRSLGADPPATRDPRALTRMAASGRFSYGGNAMRATALNVQLDDSSLRGDAAITNLDTQAMSFELALDRIDVDRYLSAAPTYAAQPPASAPAAANRSPSGSPASAAGSDAFQKLQMQGVFSVGALTAAGLNLSQVKINIEAGEGVVRITPIAANLYGGSIAGAITLTNGAPLTMRLQQSLSQVNVAALLKDVAKTDRLSGHGSVTIDLTAHGWDAAQITRSLNGRVTANLSDGAVEGVDLWFEINRALALIQKQPLPSGSSSGRTRFDTFRASADLSDGSAVTKDLSIASQNLRIAGQGSSNLVNDRIDYQVTATVLKELPTAANASGKKLADIPLLITGTMSNPQVRPDLEGMAKARLQQELGQHQDEIRQKIQNQLQNLFK